MSPCVAEGHSEDRGQVILSLDRSPGYAQGCPIGVAAWVDFPDIDLIDELRARLRL